MCVVPSAQNSNQKGDLEAAACSIVLRDETARPYGNRLSSSVATDPFVVLQTESIPDGWTYSLPLLCRRVFMAAVTIPDTKTHGLSGFSLRPPFSHQYAGPIPERCYQEIGHASLIIEVTTTAAALP